MSELVDAFLRHKGFIKEKGSLNAPLMPNILADLLHLCWYDHLRGKLKEEAKSNFNKMYESYRKFNKEFFAGFDKLQTGICVDVMDEFSEFIDDSIQQFRIAVKNKINQLCVEIGKDISDEKTEIICNMALCKFIASQANEIWGIIYKTFDGERDVDINLQGMYVYAREMLSSYSKRNTPKEFRNVDLSHDECVKQSMKDFEAKVMEFIRNWE